MWDLSPRIRKQVARAFLHKTPFTIGVTTIINGSYKISNKDTLRRTWFFLHIRIPVPNQS